LKIYQKRQTTTRSDYNFIEILGQQIAKGFD
jgi:hypothetical protein